MIFFFSAPEQNAVLLVAISKLVAVRLNNIQPILVLFACKFQKCSQRGRTKYS
jgi:hypothetical protein